MTTSNITKSPMSVHFSGVGGKGIAPAASLALAAGLRVTGDDLAANHRTEAFSAVGVPVTLGVNRAPDDADLIVSSAAVPARDHVAVPHMARLEFVQHLLSGHGKRILAVAGSLGKSTAATMIHRILSSTAPSAYIGADVPGMLCGGELAAGEWAVVEACEYRSAYNALTPEIVVCLNMVQNHEDDLGAGTAGFERSFTRFLAEGPTPPGLAVMPAEVAGLMAPRLADAGASVRVEAIGAGAPWQVEVLSQVADGSTFRLTHRGKDAGTWTVPAPGAHLIPGAACGIVSALRIGMSMAEIRAGLSRFRLPGRRMSVMHADERLVVIDDNARQPGQVKALVQALRQAHPDRALVIAVSPWGRRNKRDLSAWPQALAGADGVWVLPVGDNAVPGGEDPDADIRLAEMLRASGTAAHVVGHDTDLTGTLLERRGGGLVVATAGYDANVAQFSDLHQRAVTAFADEPQEAGR
ncbi:hypothetical protein J7F01_08935 [Streptomyces sp. ISL-22]|uniref:glutamate ligase domain-containing protein n=1 Tax=unclassified Streptomyces TaxID=2593676 RepID=UPI001BE56EBF|nr:MULTISPECIES: cyanophycin synthetase [unclassified Streptomyces]MBT2417998.1 hypothetical protein [Streptomyces sp. ISL-24]MBT2432327.1 hypothetical protein [Streptomyces sp. ISL-22]